MASSLKLDLLCPAGFTDYELIDCGNFEKLERFGKYITIRPEPQAVWTRLMDEKEWLKTAHVKFIQRSSNSGEWKKLRNMPDQWNLQHTLPNGSHIRFRLGLTAFKHVGIFPEQAVNWDFISETCKAFPHAPKVLNLFAYTGGASLAARASGAEVTHVDSIKQVVNWSNENMQLSDLSNIRWVVEDALKFVQREVKRGHQYNGIILDPPAFGHGPKGEKWKLEENIAEMMKSVMELLHPENRFLILNAYSLGLSAIVIDNFLRKTAGDSLQIGELYLNAASGCRLPLGVFGRFTQIQMKQ
jgi:23S rRNA (cytosine1962-C5)-methyltransferase